MEQKLNGRARGLRMRLFQCSGENNTSTTHHSRPIRHQSYELRLRPLVKASKGWVPDCKLRCMSVPRNRKARRPRPVAPALRRGCTCAELRTDGGSKCFGQLIGIN